MTTQQAWGVNGRMTACLRAGDPDRHGSPFEEICVKFLEVHPAQRCSFETVADLDLQPVFTLMAHIVAMSDLSPPYRMSGNRSEQIRAVLKKGQERIKNILAQE